MQGHDNTFAPAMALKQADIALEEGLSKLTEGVPPAREQLVPVPLDDASDGQLKEFGPLSLVKEADSGKIMAIASAAPLRVGADGGRSIKVNCDGGPHGSYVDIAAFQNRFSSIVWAVAVQGTRRGVRSP